MRRVWCAKPVCSFTVFALVAGFLVQPHAVAQAGGSGSPLVIPAGTSIYCELDESVTSKKKDSETGKIVRAHIWHDVEVNNTVVIKAGTPVHVEISKVKHAGVAGRKGALELSAVSTKAIDGTEVMLDGGYDKSGHSRVGMSVALFLLVAWPLIFLKGKQAELERGVLFDCTVQADQSILVAGNAPPAIRISGVNLPLSVEVLYDEMEKKEKPKDLPLRITRTEGVIDAADVVSVNGQEIKPIKLELSEPKSENGHQVAAASLELSALSKHLTKGINRFEVQSGTDKVEVILNVEL